MICNGTQKGTAILRDPDCCGNLFLHIPVKSKMELMKSLHIFNITFEMTQLEKPSFGNLAVPLASRRPMFQGILTT